ncbi:MAG: 6-hydroxycyclohex-1-ene-1-carbonyl-CoA dehydrogenase [Verrucomicrobiales bacterium]|jgi:6-hydroxycyclohex-1-ene-1-carbonyl-CoA dehydrogenase
MNDPQFPDEIHAWQMVEGPKDGEGGKFEHVSFPTPDLKPGEALVEIAACGVCRSDLSFFYTDVKTVNPPPITLGHEISGTVIAGESEWIGKEVIVPTILSCGKCELCLNGRGNRCVRQKMPGSSLGNFGGFSSHIVVPARQLCPVADRKGHSLADLAVVADAISTPYQAAIRADIQPGDKVVIIGVTGGCGFYLAQWCRKMGAETIIGIGRNDEKLARSMDHGCDAVINVTEKSDWEVQKEFWKTARRLKVEPKWGWKTFEASGSKSGQELALQLLSYTGMIVIVGYSPDEISYNISRLSAFDAELRGSWGCVAERYPEILDSVLNSEVATSGFVDQQPMSRIEAVFEDHWRTGTPLKRVVLTPDFN